MQKQQQQQQNDEDYVEEEVIYEDEEDCEEEVVDYDYDDDDGGDVDDETMLDDIQNAMKSLYEERFGSSKQNFETRSFSSSEEIIEEVIHRSSSFSSSEEIIEEIIDDLQNVKVDSNNSNSKNDEEEVAEDDEEEEEVIEEVETDDELVVYDETESVSSGQSAEDMLKEIQSSIQGVYNDRKNHQQKKHRQSSTLIEEVVIEEEILVEDGVEYEEQVIEKWFGRDEEPEDLEEACRKLIPIVYKGEDVDLERMMRRSPLPELYRYLKQHYDFKVDVTKEVAEGAVEKQNKKQTQTTLNDLFANGPPSAPKFLQQKGRS